MKKRVIPTGESLGMWMEVGPFDHGVAWLHAPDARQQKPSLELITAEQLAIIRMRNDPSSPFTRHGLWVAESYNYGNGRDAEIVIASRSLNPILQQLVEATNAHHQGNEFYLDDAAWKTLRERAEADPYKAIQSGALLVKRKSLKSEIPVEALGETPETVFLFREQAKPYGNSLKVQGIRAVPQWIVGKDYAKKQENAFGRELWVSMVDSKGGRSALLGNGTNDLLDYGRVCGVGVVPVGWVAPEAPQEGRTIDEVIHALSSRMRDNERAAEVIGAVRHLLKMAPNNPRARAFSGKEGVGLTSDEIIYCRDVFRV